jgi:hypothetical protein
LPHGARLLHIADPSESGTNRQFNVTVPEAEDRTSTLIICAGAGFLHCWERLDEDLERFLSSPRQVILVLIVERSRPLEFATHSYLLGILATSFPARKFTTRLEVYDASPTLRALRGPFFGFLPTLARRARSVLKERWHAVLGTAESPATFSALVVSVQSRAGTATRQHEPT